MKVILLEDVKSVGKKNEVVELRDGYARNVIIRKKLGIEATQKALNDLKLKNINNDKIAKEQYEEALELKKKIEASKMYFKIKVGDGDKAFGAISSKEIAEASDEQIGVQLNKKKIVMKQSIKALGKFDVDIKLHPDVTATLSIEVDKE